ncbi:MAG TPA: bifunctional 4-hydroxy-2-oxoglutarate aldolase/2-dehydro-3-deoxy-phosphogluconate aldolase [Coleofasciculaceae cyanobacterium]|jgi:2-dehydro-3-deoxyphosphogluconate aldolase/(4S)-4-hydroxy-2-oxoglutarate aldolase
MGTVESRSSVKSLLNIFSKEKLIGIVRTESADSALWAASQLLEAGFRLIEIPFTVPETPQVIEALCERFPEAVIGAGTVLEAKQAVQALGAGAQFLVAPVLNEPLIQFGLEQDIFVLPGCATPTEIYRAHTLGAPAAKFFPAGAMGGPAFLKAIRDPLPTIPIVPTGGVTLEQVPEYLSAGALAVGVGGPLLPKDVIAHRDADTLQQRAKAYLLSKGA